MEYIDSSILVGNHKFLTLVVDVAAGALITVITITIRSTKSITLVTARVMLYTILLNLGGGCVTFKARQSLEKVY